MAKTPKTPKTPKTGVRGSNPTQTFRSTQQPTDDVVTDPAVTTVTISQEGVVAAATEPGQTLQAESLKDGLTAAQAQTAESIEGGPPGLPKDEKKFSLGLSIQLQIVAFLIGFRFFMKAVKRPQYSELVPGAVGAVIDNWQLLKGLVSGALDGINVATLAALLSRLTFVKSLREMVGTFTERLDAVQSHLEDQIVTMLRPLWDHAGGMMTGHDLLQKPMMPLVDLFTLSGKQAAQSRQDNQKAGEKAVAAHTAKEAPPTEPAAPVPTVVVTPGTVPSGAQPGPVATTAHNPAGPKSPIRG